MKMLYTANGRYIRCCTEEGTRPVIIVCEKEYEVDVQEFMLWSILNWRILREEEISSFYEKMASSSNVTIHRSWQDCVQRLLVRGLLVVGTGDTEYDALYDLLSCRFIIPIGAAYSVTTNLSLRLNCCIAAISFSFCGSILLHISYPAVLNSDCSASFLVRFSFSLSLCFFFM